MIWIFQGWKKPWSWWGRWGIPLVLLKMPGTIRGLPLTISKAVLPTAGAGITLPEENFFYRDATLAAHFFYGSHFSKPNQLNAILQDHGYAPLTKHPTNVGVKILGENRGRLYGIDVYNLSQKGKANEAFNHTLNSIRVYGNIGRKLYERKSIELGVIGGLGYGNVSYTLDNKAGKPDFPALFEEPDHDGSLTDWGFMAKPEIYFSYVMPISRESVF